MISVGQETRERLRGLVLAESLMLLAGAASSEGLTEAASSEGLTEASGSASLMAHAHGCWQENSAPHYRYPSIELLECVYDTAAVFSQSK